MVATTKRAVSFRCIDEHLTSTQQDMVKQRRVYKFLHAPAEKPVIEDGSLRLGTASKFWDIENVALRDELDGQTATSVESTTFFSGHPIENFVHQTSPFYSFARSIVGPYANGDITFEQFLFQTNHDFFIYSFSYECSASVVRSFSKEPFDCVAEIYDIYGLAETLVNIHPELKGRYYSVYPVTYQKQIARRPEEEHPNPLQSMFEKSEAYKENKEGRIVFFELEKIPDGCKIVYDLKRLNVPKDFSHPDIKKWFRKGIMPLAT